METQKSEYQEYIIDKIKNLRLQHNISQLRLSQILVVSTGQIGNIESPKYPHKYTLKQICAFCEYIDYPIERIFLTDEEYNSDTIIKLLINKIIAYNE